MAEVLLSLPEFIGIVYDVVDKIRTVLHAKQEAQRLADQFKTIADLINMVCDKLKQLESSSRSKDPLLLAMNDLNPLVQQLQRVFKEISDKLQPRHGAKELLRRIKWIEDKDTVRGLLEDLEKLKSALLLALTYNSAYSAFSAQDVSSKLSDGLSLLQINLGDRLTQMNEDLNELQKIANTQRREELIERLSRTAGEIAKEDLAVDTPSPDHFGRWLLSSQQFLDWRDTQGGSLWCHGLAGAGKTTLARIVRVSLLDHFPPEKGVVKVPVVSLYCRYSQNPNELDLLAGMWSQLARLRDFSVEELDNLYGRYVRQSRPMNLDTWMSLVREEFAHFQMVFVVVDALDEFTQGFPTQLISILQSFSPKANVLYTSRYPLDDGGRRSLHRLNEIVVQAHQDDLNRFIDESFSGNEYVSREIRRNPQLAGQVKEKIVSSAQGIFQIAQVLINDLLDDDTGQEINETLDNPYDNIESAYDSTFGRFVGSKKGRKNGEHKGLDAICIICLAKIPLTLHQLCYMVSNPRNKFPVPEGAIIDKDYLIDLCGGHVMINPKSGNCFVHETVREYICRYRMADVERAQIKIIGSCLTFLRSPIASIQNWKLHHEIQALTREHPLLDYGATYWGDHLRELSVLSMEKASDFDADVDDLLQKDANLACAARVLLHRTARGFIKANQWGAWGAEQNTQGLVKGRNVIAYFGLTRLLSIRLDKRPVITNVDRGRNPFGSLLHWAVLGDHEDTLLRVLRQPGAEQLLNLADVDLIHSPLHLALLLHKTTAVRILLEAGADPRVKLARTDPSSHTLQIAVIAGDYQHVKILLNSAYSRELLTQTDVVGDLAIHSCAKKRTWKHGDVRVIQELLSHYEKAVSDGLLTLNSFYNANGLNPLHEAARRGLETTVITFLQTPLGQQLVKQSGFRQQTPLQIATVVGRKSVVRAIIDLAKDKISPLEQASLIALAARSGNCCVLEILLDPRSGFKFDEPVLRDAFHEATDGGFVECFDLMRRVYRPPNGELIYALHQAVKRGHQEIVERIANSEVDIDAPDAHGNSALHIAGAEKSFEVLNVLISHGCQLNVTDKQGATALEYSLLHKRPRVAKILLHAKADTKLVNCNDEKRNQGLVLADKLKQQGAHVPTSPSQVFTTALILKLLFGRNDEALPLINHILELAEYWCKSRTIRHEDRQYSEIDESPIYLRSLPIKGRKRSPVCKARFVVKSRDQSRGSGHGTYNQSYTWFEISTWAKSGRKDGDYVDREERLKVLVNKTGKGDWSTHTLVWPFHKDNSSNVPPGQRASQQEFTKFMEELETGDRIDLIPQAIFLNWVNFVQRAEMTVWTSCLRKVNYESNKTKRAKSVIVWAP